MFQLRIKNAFLGLHKTVMKILKYILIGTTLLLALNLLTFYLFGKQSLRDRNVSEMMKTDFENWDNLKLEFHLVSNLTLNPEIEVNKIKYPVIDINDFGESLYDDFIDSVNTAVRFKLNSDEADSIFKTNLDSLHLTYVDGYYSESTNLSPYLFNNIHFINYINSISRKEMPTKTKLGGWCEYMIFENNSKLLYCLVQWNTIIILWEEIDMYPMIAEQELAVQTYGSDFEFTSEEKLIWLLYHWVQIE